MAHDPALLALYPFVSVLEREAEAMRAEADRIDPSAWVAMPNYPSGWTAFLLDAGPWAHEFRGFDVEANRRACPHTWRVVQSIAGMKVAGFMRLEPGVVIEPHTDHREDDMVRAHLGLRLPKGERARWPELTVRLMDVRVSHSARNDGPDPRLTFMIDVRMPFAVPSTGFGPWSPGDPG